MASHQHWEEKSTDVNVASRLLLDVVGQQVDAVIVISNDSDLRLPIQESGSVFPWELSIPAAGIWPGIFGGSPATGLAGTGGTSSPKQTSGPASYQTRAGELGKPTEW